MYCICVYQGKKLMLISTSIKGRVIDSVIYNKVITLFSSTGAELMSVHQQFLQTKETCGDRLTSVKIHFRNILTKFGTEKDCIYIIIYDATKIERFFYAPLCPDQLRGLHTHLFSRYGELILQE